MTNEHTPTPLSYGAFSEMVNGKLKEKYSITHSLKILKSGMRKAKVLCAVDRKQDAEFICKAVNAHDDLVEQLTKLLRKTPFAGASGGINVFLSMEQIGDLKNALAKAQGE